MIFDNLSVKDLDAYLKDLKAYRAQTKADFDAAQRAYFHSLGSTASIDIKEELHKKSDLFASKLDKMDDAIYQIQQRLGAISSSHSIKSGTTLSGATIPTPSFTRFNAQADKILNLLKVQIAPSKVCVEPNDSIIKALFSTSGDTITVTEKLNYKRKVAVSSNLTVKGSAIDNPLFDFDRTVLGVIFFKHNSPLFQGGQRQRYGNFIFKLFEHLKAQNFISDFEVKKDRVKSSESGLCKFFCQS